MIEHRQASCGLVEEEMANENADVETATQVHRSVCENAQNPSTNAPRSTVPVSKPGTESREREEEL